MKCYAESLMLKMRYTLGVKAKRKSSGITPPRETCEVDEASHPTSKENEG